MRILLFLSFFCPFVLSAQQFYFESAMQIDAEEVNIVHFFDDEDPLIFVNHLSDLIIIGDTIFNQGSYDFTPLIFDNGDLSIGDVLNSEAYEKALTYSLNESDSDNVYLDMAFIDSLEAYIDSDDPILMYSDYGQSIATIHANPSIGEFLVSYFHFVDSTNIKSSVYSENVIHAGRFADSILFENVLGVIEPRYGIGEENIFISQKDIEGNLIWVNVFETSNETSIATLYVEGNIIYMLTNQVDGSTLRKIDASTGNLLEEYNWEAATLGHFTVRESKYYLSGWVDTETPTDLDFSENEYILPSGNGNDGVLLVYDDDMALGWAQNISGSNDSHITHFDISDAGVLYATGHISGESSFSTDLTLSASESNREMFLAHYTAFDGSFVHAEKYSGEGNSSGNHLKVIEVFGNIVDIILLASFNGELNVNVAQGEVLFQDNYEASDLSYIVFSLYYEDNVVIATESVDPDVVSLSPVPAINVLNIDIENSTKVTSMEIININGQLVKRYNQFRRSIKTDDLQIGNYVLRLQTEKGLFSKPFVKL